MNHSRRAFFRLSCADKSRHRKRRSRTEGGRCKQKAIGCSCRNDRASGPILSTCWRDLRRPKFASSCPAEAKLLNRRSLKLVSSDFQGIAGCKRFLAVLRAGPWWLVCLRERERLVWFSCSYFGSELLQLPEKKTLCQLKIVPIRRRRKEKICVTRCVTRASKMGALLITRDDRDSD